MGCLGFDLLPIAVLEVVVVETESSEAGGSTQKISKCSGNQPSNPKSKGFDITPTPKNQVRNL